MTEFEQAVLDILANSEEPLGWYQIERRLSNHNLRERPNLLTVLAKLRDEGLVEGVAATTEPRLRYRANAPLGR